MRVINGTNDLVSFLFADQLGSTNVVSDPVGQMVSLSLYMPWGESRGEAGTTLTDYAYTGQRNMDYIGLEWYNSRWYDDELGRFTQPDSIVPDPVDPNSYDRYSYSANNPITHTDPSGHCWGIASGLRGVPGYGTTCQNLDTALTIIKSDQATLGEKDLAAGYIVAETTAHVTLVAGVALLACSGVAACAKVAQTALGFGTTAATVCEAEECANQAETAETALNAIRNMTGNAKGTAYENWLKDTTGGNGSFTLGGTQFDNKVGNVLMEGKAWDWSKFDLSQFQNQVGRANAIATRNDYQYVVHLLNKPPQPVIDWLIKNGIDYVIESGAQ